MQAVLSLVLGLEKGMAMCAVMSFVPPSSTSPVLQPG